MTQPDLDVPGGGLFSHVRHYCNQAAAAYSGPNGFNWWVAAMPYIVASGTSVAVVSDPNSPYWFAVSDSDFTPQFGVVGVTLTEDTGDGTLTFTKTVDGQLEVTVFNDLCASVPGSLISHTDTHGITTTATATSDGFTRETTAPPKNNKIAF